MKYEEFVKRAREKHGDKYTYPEFEETSCINKVQIICPEHGEFYQQIYVHLRGDGCPKCRGRRNWTTEDFIKAAREKHGDKFDYSKSEYKGRRTKVCIMCKELITEDNPNGEFWQLPLCHIDSPTGMPFQGKRGREYGKITDEEEIEIKTKEFVQKAKEKWGNKIDFSKVVYTGCMQKVELICPEHGSFYASPNSVLSNHGCPNCTKNQKLTVESFKEKASKVHNNKYNYSRIKKIDSSNENVEIICPEHGVFWQNITHHLCGRGCPSCSKNKPLTTDEFIERSSKIHNNKYDYSKTVYTRANEGVLIICPVHGEFIQTPNSHLQGQGCPHCNESHAEREISILLTENNIEFQREVSIDGIKYKHHMPFDFYLPKLNVLIECQGKQHFLPSKKFIEPFEGRVEKDYIKFKGAKEKGLTLLYFSDARNIKSHLQDNDKFKEMYSQNFFTSYSKLMQKIRSLT